MKQITLDFEALGVESFLVGGGIEDAHGAPDGAEAMGITRYCTRTCP